jgi:hypothetical protein
MTIAIVVVCEGANDLATGCALADRVICAHADWITSEVIDDYRRWQGVSSHEHYLAWTSVKAHARQRNIRAYGHFDDRPGAMDAWILV